MSVDDGQVRAFVRRRASGWPTSMHVVRLSDERLVVHSPTRIDDATYDAIEALGTPALLFAPNHFHHLGLPPYRARFPRTRAVAARGAIARLRSKGHDDLHPVEDLDELQGARFLVPEGTKSGEAWLAVDGNDGPTWIVCDAFFHETRPIGGLEGAVLRALKIAPGLAIGATFTLMCLRDRGRYGAWVREALRRERPRRVLFSHGDPLEGDVVTKLLAILDARVPAKG